MADLHLPTTLPPLFPGLPRRLDVDAATVAEAIEHLDERWPGLRDRLCEPGPALRRHINVYVDRERAVFRANADLFEPRARGASRVWERLVERSARCPEPFREHVDRNSVHRQRDQHRPLVRRETVLDRLLDRREELALLGLRRRLQATAREDLPALRLERDLAALPGATPELGGRLVEGELVHPGREAACSAVVVESREHGDERVAGRLAAKVAE